MNSGRNMPINGQTRIKDLLEFNQEEVIRALLKLNKNFGKLRNPVLRKLFAGRVTIADACKIAGSPILAFMESMKQIGFSIDEEKNGKEEPSQPGPSINEPDSYLTLDVRPSLARDKDPLKEIMAGINMLAENQGLKLINTFEPAPLIHLLAKKGFTHRVEVADDNTVITYFNRTAAGIKEVIPLPADEADFDDGQFDRVLATIAPGKIKYLDVRQLEMPKPMLSILAESPHLIVGDALFVYHKKIPVLLLPELEKQGLKYLFKNISPGNVNMLIYKL
ncbi:MAG: DUF2249 domain-containing protein [Sphingobacteriales bacterium]